jgi:multidrug efflux system membrane fusion protein
MRVLPLITALLVAGALYLLILERPALMDAVNAPEGPVSRIATAIRAPEAAEPAAPEPAAPEPAAQPPTIADPAARASSRRVAVVALPVQAQSIESGILLRGRTEATRHVDVRSETSGLVVSEPVRKGSFVEAGTTLCELSPGTRLASLAEAEARLAEAQLNLRAAEQLSQGGFASETRAASARAAFQAAQAGVEAARREIARLTITAPFAGLLETDAAETGSLLQPGSLCATVIQLDPIRLVGFVAEADVDRVAVGAAARARLVTGREIAGHVTFLSRSADERTRTFRVEIEVPNRDFSIRDGQTAEILIASRGTSAHLLPASALTLDDRGRLGVRLVEGEGEAAVARFAPVQVVRDTPAGVWVAGLPEAAQVIVLGQEYVTDGTPLAVTLREAGQ